MRTKIKAIDEELEELVRDGDRSSSQSKSSKSQKSGLKNANDQFKSEKHLGANILKHAKDSTDSILG